MQNRSAGILAAILLFIPLYSSAQKMVNSPIARYNIGILEKPGTFRTLGMGGTGTGMRENSTIYYMNPASYSSIDTNSFLFDFGMDYGLNILSDGNSTDLSEDLNFHHLIMGFPITKKWGIATGLVPVTNGYYNVSETVKEGDPGYDEITGEYISYHSGSGGFTSVFLGTGLNITKNLSAGLNMSFLFGSIKRYNEFDFADYYYTFQTNMTEKYQMRGMGLDMGLQYSAALKNNYFLNLGTSYSTGKKCKSTFESIIYRYNVFTSTDTLPGSYTLNDSTRAFVPGTFRAGFSFGKKNKFVAGVDYVYSFWENADFNNLTSPTSNTRTLLFGAEYIPDRFSNYSFIKRIEYRLGGHIGNNYLLFNGSKINEFGVSMGVGVPMRRSFSKTNFYADFTRKSLTGQPFTHNENYFTFGISINLFDVWFLKRKYE